MWEGRRNARGVHHFKSSSGGTNCIHSGKLGRPRHGSRSLGGHWGIRGVHRYLTLGVSRELDHEGRPGLQPSVCGFATRTCEREPGASYGGYGSTTSLPLSEKMNMRKMRMLMSGWW